MIKKNIRTLLALGVACINFTVTEVKAFGVEIIQRPVEKGIPLNSFDHFHCDKNPNATSADFHDERSYDVTSVKNLGLPGSPDHVVHQFGKKLLIIPGNTYQSRMVCRAGTEKERFLITVLMPKIEPVKAESLFSRITRRLSFYDPAELEEVLRQQFWWDLVDISNDMMASADKGPEKRGGDTTSPDDHDSPYPGKKGLFPGSDGYGGNDDDTDDDDRFPGGSLLESSLASLTVPLKSSGAFFEDFGGFWFPKTNEKKKAKKNKKINMVVVPSGNDSNSSPIIEITANPVIENLTVIQFALMIGGFEINEDLQDQLSNLDQLSAAELEQLANGFSTTITNIDSLMADNAIQVPSLSNVQLVQILLKIETLIRELITINELLNDPDTSKDLRRVRDNLRMLIGNRLASTVLGSNKVTVSGDASQHEILLRVLLESDTHDPSETEEIDQEELEELMDEYIRKVREGITGQELIRALVAKIEAIQRQMDRREANLDSAHGSWLRALKNRLDTLRIELAAAEQSLDTVINNYFFVPSTFSNRVTDEPEDKGGKQAGKGGDKKNPPPGTNSPGRLNIAATPPERGSAHQPPSSSPRDGNEDDDSGGDEDEGGGGEPSNDWIDSDAKRDQAVWLAEQLRERSMQSDANRAQAGTLLFKFEDKPEIRDEIIRRVRVFFDGQYPALIGTLPAEGVTKLEGYVSAMLNVMRGVALANILFDVANRDQLAEIREMYNKYVKGLMGQSMRKADPIEFTDSQEWDISFRHNGDDWSHSHESGSPIVEQALLQTELSALLQTDEDGFIRFTPEQRRMYMRAFLQHPNSGRTPVQFRYSRVSDRAGRSILTRSYELHQFGELREHMEERFPTASGTVRANPLSRINSLIAQTSQRGGIEDSVQLIFNQHPDAAAMLYWLFEPNHSTVPLSQMVFGTQIAEGLLQQNGLPLLSPSSSEQSDLSNQYCDVIVYSNGRMRIHYKVSYDRISRNNEVTGQAENYPASFTLEFELDFDISQVEGIRPLSRRFHYQGAISQEQQLNLSAALKAEDKAGDQKTIEDIKKLPEKLRRLIEEYEAAAAVLNLSESESIAEWRQQAGRSLRFALDGYRKMLAAVRTRNLTKHSEYIKARRAIAAMTERSGLKKGAEAFVELSLYERLMAAVDDYLKKETEVFVIESASCTKTCMEQQMMLDDKEQGDLSYGAVFELFEQHRQQVQDTLAALQDIQRIIETHRPVTISAIVSINGRVQELSGQLDRLKAEYTEARHDLNKRKNELSRAGANVEVFGIFDTVNTMVSVGWLYSEELHTSLGNQQRATEQHIEAAVGSLAVGKGKGQTTSKENSKKERRKKLKAVSTMGLHRGVSLSETSTPRKRSWWDIRRLLSSGSTSPASSEAMHSGAGSVDNILDLSNLQELAPSDLTQRRQWRRGSVGAATVPQRNLLRRAPLSQSQGDMRRVNVRQVLTSSNSNLGIPSPEYLVTPDVSTDGLLSPEIPSGYGAGLYLGPPVYTPPSSSLTPTSSQGGLNSLESTHSLPQPDSSEIPVVHSRSLSDGLQHNVRVPINTLRNRPSRRVRVMSTISSPVTSPRRFGRDEAAFNLRPTGSGGHPLMRHYLRSHSHSHGDRRPEIIVSPEELSHSAVSGHTDRAESNLRLLLSNNAPSGSLAQTIFLELQSRDITSSDFGRWLRNHEPPSISTDDDYDHLEPGNNWETVGIQIREYLNARHSIAELAGRLLEILGSSFNEKLEQLARNAQATQLRSRKVIML